MGPVTYLKNAVQALPFSRRKNKTRRSAVVRIVQLKIRPDTPNKDDMVKRRFTEPSPSMWTFEPTEPHRRTFIVLHGRGDGGTTFGSMFLGMSELSNGLTLLDNFPDTKFICPTSEMRKAVSLGEHEVCQWFDITNLKQPALEEENQIQGLTESVGMVHNLIKQELELLKDPKKIFIGGLSQGCATTLHAMLTLDVPLGGYIGMSGWLPFVAHLESILELEPPVQSVDKTDLDGPDLIENKEPENVVSQSQIVQAINFLRKNIGLQELEDDKLPVLQTPVWIGHGSGDMTIKYYLGLQIDKTLRRLGMNVEFVEYKNFHHWYKVPDELNDIANFLRSQK